VDSCILAEKAMNPYILVVDDDLELQSLFQMILRRSFRISQADCGEQALALALDTVPDLILLDVMLPDIDGLEICRRLKADPHTRSIPVILVTARADILSLVEEQQLPVADVIRKPFAPRELLQCVNKVLQQSGVSRETDRLRPFSAPA
jgi:DNA-binding response OmpR family regulator